MKIVVDEKEFDRLFHLCERNYEYDHEFMHGNETVPAFYKTMRYAKLQQMRQDLETLKFALKNA